MTAHPGRVREVIDVDLPRPRCYEMRSEKLFIALRALRHRHRSRRGDQRRDGGRGLIIQPESWPD
jgi:hypothetical protein